MTSGPPNSDVDEPIEGIDRAEDAAWGDYPIDTVLIRNENRTVHDVLRRIAQGSFVMDPDFQRDFIWDQDKQSKLIESVLMRIPLPVFYLAEDAAGRMIVVDGLQRLSTFQRFVGNDSRLRLPQQDELDKKRFSDLSPKLQNRIEDCNLILYIIDAKVPERARLDIFERVNGGVPLTRQQMRNCLFMGQATRFLKEEAHTAQFTGATGFSLKSSTMRDREFVNRYCAFALLPLTDYKGDMDEFLAAALETMNAAPPAALEALSARFRRSLANNTTLFGQHAFRKHSPKQGGRGILNAALWDVMSTGLAQYSETVVAERTMDLREGFYRLLRDPDFDRAISLATGDVQRVKLRFDKAQRMFAEVLGDSPA